MATEPLHPETLQKRLLQFDEKPHFRINPSTNQITDVVNTTAQTHLENARAAYRYVCPSIGGRVAKTAPIPKSRAQAYCIYLQRIKTRFKESLTFEEHREIQHRAYAIKLGGALHHKYFENDPFKQFIASNHFHHGMFSLSLQLPVNGRGTPQIPCVDGNEEIHSIPWDDFTITRKRDGYILHSPHHKITLKTDEHFALTSDYTLTYQGIEKRSRYKGDTLIPFAERAENDGLPDRYLDVIVATLEDQGDDDLGGYANQHAYFELGSPHFRYSFGKYPALEHLSAADLACAAALKKGRYESPDSYTYMPEEGRSYTRLRLALRPNAFDRIKERFQNDRRADAVSFSMLQQNCTSYVTDVLSEIGVDIDATIELPEYVFLKLPLPVIHACTTAHTYLIEPLPTAIRKVMRITCAPLLHLYKIALGLLLKSMSLRNTTGQENTDVSFTNIFLGRVKFHHPIKLRQKMREYREKHSNNKPRAK